VDASLPIDSTMLLVGLLLLVAVLVTAARDRLQVPGALLFLGLGMLAGSDGLGLVSLDATDMVRDIGIVALVIILFEGGLTTKPRDLRTAGVPGFVLANVGVLTTTVVVGAALVLVLRLDWNTALLLGAIVSSTDAAAVFDLLRRAPLPRRLGSALEVESGANDPFAVILTIGLLTVMDGGGTGVQELFVFGARQLVGGIVVGVVLGGLGALLLRRVRLPAQSLYPVSAFAIALLTYGAGAAIGASGLFAAYLSGIIIGATVPRHRRTIRNFATSMASMAEIGLFLMLGLLVFPSELPGVAIPALAVTIILVLIARPLGVALSLAPFGFSWREQAIVSWAGLRGAVPIVLATFPLIAGVPEANTIFNVVFFVVLVSVTVQGLTVVPLVRRLGLETERPAWESVVEALPLDLAEATLVELQVTDEMAAAGHRLVDLPDVPGLLVTTIVRGQQVIIPTGETQLQAGDLAIITMSSRDDAAAVVSDWAHGQLPPPWPGRPDQ